MSKAGEEEEDEERFHDSLDRILSSASCSCSPSASETDDDEEEEKEDYDRGSDCSPELCYSGLLPRFPRGVSRNYDVWMSRPCSVEERRVGLLIRMGLNRDPSLLYRRSSLSFPCHRLIRNGVVSFNDGGDSSSGMVMVRSKSNGDCGYEKDPQVSLVASRGSHYCTDASKVSSSDSPDEPSVVNVGEQNGRFSDFLDLNVESNGMEEVDAMCMIKNLDNGKKFVVNKVREDGTWEKIKEVGTGRQLTMEEFSSEMCVGTSPIVQELMRRQNFEDGSNGGSVSNSNGGFGGVLKMKKSRSWLKSIKNVASSVMGHRERRSSDERDTSSEKGGRRSSSATDDIDSQDVCFHGPERVRVRQYGKSVKDVSALFKSQEIQAHNGSIWAIKFSLDGKYLASAGEDCVIQVWQVLETESKGDLLLDKSEDGNHQVVCLSNGSPDISSLSPRLDGHSEKKRRGRSAITRKSASLEQILLPETLFSLSEKPMCSLQGHLDDILDLSWSKSQQLLSSSMDKTVRLWDLSSKSCLKVFSHSDYVTCIQFNPVDDRYFISGSLDAKVRIWSIPDRQVVDWTDLHEMVTAACYTPDGQGALVGSYKGSCRLYNTSENKLLQKSQINLQNKKKSHQKKITGFQFSPGSTSEVLITSADSRIRAIDGIDLIHKFKGFRNSNSQISASVTSNGKYVISASEDSCVYIWRHDNESQPNRSKVGVTRSYELFHCQDVSVAIPWPGMICDSWGFPNLSPLRHDDEAVVSSAAYQNNLPVDEANESGSPWESGCSNSPLHGTLPAPSPNGFLFDRISATWPEEKLVSPAVKSRNPSHSSVDFSNGVTYQNRSAWGMVIVTAGLRGEIKTFQNFGLPVRI